MTAPNRAAQPSLDGGVGGHSPFTRPGWVALGQSSRTQMADDTRSMGLRSVRSRSAWVLQATPLRGSIGVYPTCFLGSDLDQARTSRSMGHCDVQVFGRRWGGSPLLLRLHAMPGIPAAYSSHTTPTLRSQMIAEWLLPAVLVMGCEQRGSSRSSGTHGFIPSSGGRRPGQPSQWHRPLG